ncbi:PIN like domain protein [anaerobic digester metagenome]
MWIPHQAALEYQKNRLNVIKQQKKAYDEINEVIDENISDIKTGLKRFNRHPFINVRSLIDKIEKVSEEIKQELVDQKKSILT